MCPLKLVQNSYARVIEPLQLIKGGLQIDTSTKPTAVVLLAWTAK